MLTPEQETEKKLIGEELAAWLPIDELYCKQLVLAAHMSGLITDEEFETSKIELDLYYKSIIYSAESPPIPVRLDKKYELLKDSD